MEQPLITLLCKEQAAEAALNGSSARKAPRGEAAKRQTIFAEENFVSKILCRQGEDMQRPLQSAEADSFPDGEAGNAG